MIPKMSPNTQAILLLTAPLIAGRGPVSKDILSPSEYKRFAKALLEIQCQPADLLSLNAAEILRKCQSDIDESRLMRLLGRGFLLSQAIERWQARAIWVLSRADVDYPRLLKSRLREDAPAVIYGCGDKGLLDSGGLAVVGSRNVENSLIRYTKDVARLAAQSGRMIVSGGAKGVDQAAMSGALEAGGNVCGVLADSLEKTAMNRDYRNLLLEGQLALISTCDPSAGFNVGNAMQRNKLIYALADAALVVNSDFKKGGTWSGAVEQLDKFKFVPLFVRSTGEPSKGLDELRKKGAIDWPNPKDSDAFESIFKVAASKPVPSPQADLTLVSYDMPSVMVMPPKLAIDTIPVIGVHSVAVSQPVASSNQQFYETPSELDLPAQLDLNNSSDTIGLSTTSTSNSADILFDAVRELIQLLLKSSMKDTEVAHALNVTNAQAKVWLQRLVEEGVIEKQNKPVGYVIKQSQLFD